MLIAHWVELQTHDELVGDHCMKLEAPDELVSDCCTELEAPGELVGEHQLEFEAVVEFEALVDHLLGPSDSLSGKVLETRSGSLLVALDSPPIAAGWRSLIATLWVMRTCLGTLNFKRKKKCKLSWLTKVHKLQIQLTLCILIKLGLFIRVKQPF